MRADSGTGAMRAGGHVDVKLTCLHSWSKVIIRHGECQCLSGIVMGEGRMRLSQLNPAHVGTNSNSLPRFSATIQLLFS